MEAALAERVAQLFGWARIGFYDFAARRAGLDIDTSSMMVLGALHDAGPARTTQLAEVMGLDSSTVSRHVAKVVDRGWATRSTDANDGRAAVIALTASGKEVRERLWAQWGELVRDLTATWTAREREQCLDLVSRIYQGVREASSRSGPPA